MIIRPQEGAQERFLASSADIVFYGGQAGGGKTFALLLEPVRHSNNKLFNAMIFRRQTVDIKGTGGLWDESMKLYTHLGAHPRRHELEWIFRSGARLKMGHLEYEDTVYNYQGTQINLLCFDEITHFTEFQFFYMLSRNRSVSGVKPYVRATTNPDADSWVRKFIDWWIDQETGYAIPDRSGVVRYFIRFENKIVWADSPMELRYYNEALKKSALRAGNPDADNFDAVKSFTFIHASLEDNKILMKIDPGYIANLAIQDTVEKERLMKGNWNISRSTMGRILHRSYFKRYDSSFLPSYADKYFVVDSANKVQTANDFSVIGLFGRTQEGVYDIIDWQRERLEAPDLEQAIIDKWNKWKRLGLRGVFIESGGGGTSLMQNLRRKGIPAFEIQPKIVTPDAQTKKKNPARDKYSRLSDVLGIIYAGFVRVPINAAWADKFFEECENFRGDLKHVPMSDEDGAGHDDQVDVLAYGLSEQVRNFKQPLKINNNTLMSLMSN